MAVNKVIYNTESGEEVLVDLTGDSVSPETLAEGVTAHDASGVIITGTATPITVVQETGTSTTAVMSQKAVTDTIETLGDTVELYQRENNLSFEAMGERIDGISIPTNVSAFTNDAGYIKETELNNITQEVSDIKSQYALKTEIPTVPVQSVNGQTGTVILDADDVGADAKGTASSAVSSHNTNTGAHNDIRLLIEGLTTRINTALNSDDSTLDQMSEVVSYIKNNKFLIDGITTNKVNVVDIINNLTTNVTNKPLSAAQGVALKALIDGLSTGKLDVSALSSAITQALTEAKASGEFDGADGKDGSNGVSITKVEQTTTSSADGGTNVITVTLSDGKTFTFNVKNGGKGSTGATGATGATGERGTGILNTTTGIAAYTTTTNGIKPNYRILLSTLKTQAKVNEVLIGDIVRYSTFLYPVITLDTDYAYLGTRTSIQGGAGTSISISSITESGESEGENVVTFSDKKTLTIKNGKDGADGADGAPGVPGSDGAPGADGYTPIRGTDYWTPEDEAEWSEYIASELAKRGQLKPEYAQSIEECTDTAKLYVLPDGMIYAYMLTEKEVESGAGYTNLLPSAVDTDGVTIYGGDYNGDGVNDGYKTKTRLSGSSGSTSNSDILMCASGFIPASDGAVIRIKGVYPVTGVSAYVISYTSEKVRIANQVIGQTTGGNKDTPTTQDWSISASDAVFSYNDGILTATLNSNFGTDIAFIRFSGYMDENTIVTVNQEIKEGGGTEIVTEEAWVSTGLAFVPADYEDRIIAVEDKAFSNTKRIIELEKSVENGGAGDATEKDAWSRIRNWDSPIYDRVPTFQLAIENPAVTSAEKTVASIYAKYDALVDANPNYVTKTDLGVCSDNTTHVYRYDFCEPEPHHQSGMQWSEKKPVVICASGIHWEWGGVYSLYYALKAIAENPELDDLRRNVHFVVVPIINPYCFTDIGSYSETYGVLNANGVQIHRNFEVGFIYPGQSGYQELGTRNHGGTEPLSEIETQNIDNIFKQYPDAALFLTCHSAQRDTQWGTGFIWASTATNYTCNLGFRLVDKLSKAWHKKYGTTWEEGFARENEFVLSDKTAYPNAIALTEGDYRAGHAHVSATDGTETRQATKYGIQGANVEVLDTFWVLSDTGLDSKVTTHGAEVYINYLLMYMGCYDHKDKKEYAPNLPWSE